MADRTLVTNDGSIDLSIETQADLSALQYFFVKLDASELAVAAGAAAPLGILQNAPDGSSDAKTAIVRVQGISKLKVAETVTFGQRLVSTAASKGEVADAADEEIGARSLTSADANDLAQVQLMFGKAVSSDA